MIKLEADVTYTIQGDGVPDDEAKKFEISLREFLKFYRAESGEVLGYKVNVTGEEIQ